MILRRLISSFLIQAMLLTSASAYSPSSKTVFLMNDDRELRCQITTEAAKLFSLEQLENLIQKDALAVKVGESQVNELRPCNEDDAFYAEIVFSKPESASAQAILNVALLAYAVAAGIVLLSLVGSLAEPLILQLKDLATKSFASSNDRELQQNLEETIKAICGERDALVTSDGVQCLDEDLTVGSSR